VLKKVANDPVILVIDDNIHVLQVILSHLKMMGYGTVVTAQDGFEGFRRLRECHPDLILLDFEMPKMDGLEFVQRLRQTGDLTPIVIISAYLRTQAQFIDKDVTVFLGKPFSLGNLFAVVKAVLRKVKEKPQRELECASILQFADLKLDTTARLGWRDVRGLELTAKEFDLLAFFLQNPLRVLCRDLIRDHVWGFDFEGRSNIIDVYIGYLRVELEKEGEQRLIHTVRSVGYVLRWSSA
jgi:two-component system response regulator MprA